jgi:hypothetical protein
MVFDRSVTGRSNGGLIFIFNKGLMGGGSVAEGRKQRAAKWGFADLGPLIRGKSGLFQDDRLRRGDCYAARRIQLP